MKIQSRLSSGSCGGSPSRTACGLSRMTAAMTNKQAIPQSRNNCHGCAQCFHPPGFAARGSMMWRPTAACTQSASDVGVLG